MTVVGDTGHNQSSGDGDGNGDDVQRDDDREERDDTVVGDTDDQLEQ